MFCFPAARLSTVCYCLFSSASEHSDETNSPASVQLTAHPQHHFFSLTHSLTLFELLDPFLFGCLHFHNLYFFLFLLSLSLTMCTLPPPTQPADVRCYFKTYFSLKKKLVLTLGAPTAIPSNLTSLKEAGVCVLYRPANLYCLFINHKHD